ncbi:hypothetical protein ACJ72_06313 [Emergomyces africanus]|uniref:Uncharacterized protein n=1 Tax=Emergomyces africanus TaxID=1955775 RepID=A0A1B7NRQ4_9EURO|nr:hypothetical protein ACJ72_06313 [Emergomyces africanus]
MAIAIDRRLIRGMGNFDKSSGTISKKDSDDLTLAHIFQSGHHEDIESRCYGLSAESLLGTSESTLTDWPGQDIYDAKSQFAITPTPTSGCLFRPYNRWRRTARKLASLYISTPTVIGGRDLDPNSGSEVASWT